MRRHILWLSAFALLGTMQAVGEELRGVDHIKDWTIYMTTADDLECGIISLPKQQLAIRDGKEVEVKRGEIYLAVSVDPKDPPPHYRVSYQSGFPFKQNSTVTLNIDNESYTFEVGRTEVDNEFAWPPSPEDDNKVVDAMKKGLNAVLTATSRRGNEIRDTFSLLGVSDALKIAEQRCSVNS